MSTYIGGAAEKKPLAVSGEMVYNQYNSREGNEKMKKNKRAWIVRIVALICALLMVGTILLAALSR